MLLTNSSRTECPSGSEEHSQPAHAHAHVHVRVYAHANVHMHVAPPASVTSCFQPKDVQPYCVPFSRQKVPQLQARLGRQVCDAYEVLYQYPSKPDPCMLTALPHRKSTCHPSLVISLSRTPNPPSSLAPFHRSPGVAPQAPLLSQPALTSPVHHLEGASRCSWRASP